jgi:hypothetical protein
MKQSEWTDIKRNTWSRWLGWMTRYQIRPHAGKTYMTRHDMTYHPRVKQNGTTQMTSQGTTGSVTSRSAAIYQDNTPSSVDLFFEPLGSSNCGRGRTRSSVISSAVLRGRSLRRPSAAPPHDGCVQGGGLQPHRRWRTHSAQPHFAAVMCNARGSNITWSQNPFAQNPSISEKGGVLSH